VSETFDPDWLALREPVDHRSRSAELLAPLRVWWEARRGSAVLDLGCGTGSNVRYLAPHLPGPVRWTLIDHDPVVLGRARSMTALVEVRTLLQDLGRPLASEVEGSHLVTAAALLDLVSERWLEALVDACAEAGCAALFALAYDGRIEWSGGAADAALAATDALVADAVNAHQRRDKGLGPALGPTASVVAERLFRARGYEISVRRSDWVLGDEDGVLVDALVEGWVSAATEQRPERADQLRAWATRRTRQRSGFELRVGHQDVLALPPG
jgi:SAM-dependent methyltransferase